MHKRAAIRFIKRGRELEAIERLEWVASFKASLKEKR